MPEDLSKYHQPVAGLFSSTETAEGFSLSAGQIEFFHENGYLAGIRILTGEQIEILRGDLKKLMNPDEETRKLFYEFHHNESNDADQILFHALGAWRASRAFHDLLWNPRFTAPAAQILNGAVRFWHDQLFVKPARHGGVVAWHQDYSYWTRTAPVAHLTCWIGLDDSTRENGCLHYVPRSHQWNLLPRSALASDMNAIFEVLNAGQKREFQPVAIELKAGEASFHHPLMIHGSYENFSENPRRATVINVFRDGVKSAADEPLLAGVPAIRRGEKIEGQFFPLLIDV
ncbi:MAG TPA: phytanoyl-CoA dioxygenase family protein [Pyrinomonadaceae bacterium]|jgi:ectoine hydroxylase-related dioxygenase (phytanoyl-CoA dioxygenase family)